MKKAKLGVILGVLTLMAVTTGCSALVGDKWVAKVNGASITTNEYDARVTAAQTTYEKQGMKFDTEQGKKDLVQIKSQVLNRMVDTKLINQEVVSLKLNTDDAAVLEEEAIIKKNIGDATKFEETLKQQGMTELELRSMMAVYANKTADIKTLSEAEVKAYFDKNIATYTQIESVTAHHILLKTEEEAKAIITQIEAADKTKTSIMNLFEQIAKEKSIEAVAKQSGGSLGTFNKGQMVPEFEAAAFSQLAGTISTIPVKTQFGYHVIYVDEHTPSVDIDYDKVKHQVEKDMLVEAKDAKYETYVTDLHAKANIEYANAFNTKGK